MKIVILAGGSGTRLWPLSRQKKPKQFQKLISNRTLFQETLRRVKFINPENIYIATNEEYAKEAIRQARPFRIPKENFIIEPALRDTASCIGLAATILSKKSSPSEVMSVIYADHLVQDEKEFRKLLKIAEYLAKNENTLNIIEVKARFPNIHLGYVKIGKPLKEVDGVEIYSFQKFIEKPNLHQARKFLESYKYLWNTGFYVWQIKTILEKFQEHLPNTYRQLIKIKKAVGTRNEAQTIKKYYEKCDKISIDYGIMEKVSQKEVRIIPAELGWSDIGTWESIFDELTENNSENLIRAKHIGIDTTGTVIYGEKKKLIATVGIKDLVIVDTKDALIVCPKGRSQEVKKIVEQLQKNKEKKYL